MARSDSPSGLNGYETRVIYILALVVFLGAAGMWAYMTLARNQEAPREILLILGFGVAFIRDYLTESRMAKRLDFYEKEVVSHMVAQQGQIVRQENERKNREQPVATRQERENSGNTR